MHRILIGYGGGDSAGDALALGQLLARTTGAELVLACVYSDEPVMSEDYRLARQREAEEKLDAALARVASSGLASHGVAHPSRRRADADARLEEALGALGDTQRATGAVVTGEPALALAAAAKSDALDLLVIGSRGYGPFHGAMAGGVSSHLARHASCPLVVVPHRATAAPGDGEAEWPSSRRLAGG